MASPTIEGWSVKAAARWKIVWKYVENEMGNFRIKFVAKRMSSMILKSRFLLLFLFLPFLLLEKSNNNNFPLSCVHSTIFYFSYYFFKLVLSFYCRPKAPFFQILQKYWAKFVLEFASPWMNKFQQMKPKCRYGVLHHRCVWRTINNKIGIVQWQASIYCV